MVRGTTKDAQEFMRLALAKLPEDATPQRLLKVMRSLRIGDKLGTRIRFMRQKSGMTQGDFARKLGTHRPIVCRIEAGKHEPSILTIVEYAAALGVQPSDIFSALDEETDEDSDASDEVP